MSNQTLPARIGFLQMEVIFGAKAHNISTASSLLKSTDSADLIVLPELAFTGYDFLDRDEVASLAEPFASGTTADFLFSQARRTGAVMVAGYAERDGDRFYNSAMMALPDGTFFNYRKLHLFSRENELFLPGDQPPAVFETPLGPLGMMICFDWFFPECARALALAGARVIAHPSNLVLPYCQKAMYCRSVENHVFTITANRTGTEDHAQRKLTFTGQSQVLDPSGTILTSAGVAENRLALTSCDLTIADDKQINPHNHLFENRRVDLYGSMLATPRS